MANTNDKMIRITEEDLNKTKPTDYVVRRLGLAMAHGFHADLACIIEKDLYKHTAVVQDKEFLEDLHRINGTSPQTSDPKQPTTAELDRRLSITARDADDAYHYCHRLEDRIKKLEAQNHRLETAVSKLICGLESSPLPRRIESMHHIWGVPIDMPMRPIRERMRELVEEPRSKIEDVPDYRPGVTINCEGDWEP